MKYRFWSANEEQGNYAVSGFLQYIAATGSQGFTTGTDILQTGLLLGKGWGPFDVQMNVAAEFPLSGNQAAHNFGKPLLANMLAQYKLWDYVWPEVELNFTWWMDGPRQGNTVTSARAPGRRTLFCRHVRRVPTGHRLRNLADVGFLSV